MTPLVLHVTGARPNFPKAAPVLEGLAAYDVEQLLVHTGQHYDDKMSEIFFRQLGIPKPDVNLGVGSGAHGAQTAKVMEALEALFTERRPDLVVVYGDVNSTVAAALVASKMGITFAHVEAGLRSFDMTMPEEINRLVTDRLSDLLLTTSTDAIGHLGNEGTDPDKIHFVGNPMIDTLLKNRHRFDADAVGKDVGIEGDYIVATLHRPGNVDDPEDVKELVAAMHAVADQAQIVIPLHPRGRARLEQAGFLDHDRIRVIEPLGYIEFMGLVRGAAAVVTDSGGVQEETTILGVPCLTLRPNTERPVTITHGTNQLVDRHTLVERARHVLATGPLAEWDTPPLWDGHAGARIAKVLASSVGA
ncbi:UDP-N-acetylglucosamine 2-epimerase (non-hydrolyzing) [Janibacter sp. DB-40]|uniref:non-hydrolyzing UDP-N-acetylglucosamine 2-epimerase n=1 Tax=Janibacter sp. DB-40 TaxID=3028808 RepID=UPI002405B6FF|nr:UDP-N-acetylglucosamine 2-epimerase (non-hydrolyzing) [Janibacter sp. DB-40]